MQNLCCPYCGSTNTHTNEVPEQRIAKVSENEYSFYQSPSYVVVCHECNKHLDVTVPCANCGSRNFIVAEAENPVEVEIINLEGIQANQMDIICRNCNAKVPTV